MSLFGGIFNSLFGGGGSTSTSTSTSSNTVNVTVTPQVGLAIDTGPLEDAINSLSGAESSGQSAVAAAVATSGLATAAALKSQSQALSQALGGSGQTELIVAGIGLLGALIIAHVIKIPGVKL